MVHGDGFAADLILVTTRVVKITIRFTQTWSDNRQTANTAKDQIAIAGLGSGGRPVTSNADAVGFAKRYYLHRTRINHGQAFVGAHPYIALFIFENFIYEIIG